MRDQIRLEPWALTKASIAYQCPLRFRHQYINKTTPDHIVDPAGRIGKAVHAALEHLFNGHTMLESLKRGCVANELTRNEMMEVRSLEDNLKIFITKIEGFIKKNGAVRSEVKSELHVGMTKDFTPTSYGDSSCYFRGVFDLVIPISKDGLTTWVVMDHKSGAVRDGVDWTEYEEQLSAYAILSVVQDPNVAYVQTALHWVRASEDSKRFSWSKRWSRDHVLNEFKPWLKKYVDGAVLRATSAPMAIKGPGCAWCPFKYACPEYRKT